MAQVKRLALDFSSGHDLGFVSSRPTSGSMLTVWSPLGILSFSPSLSLSHPSSKKKKKEKKEWGESLRE